MLLQGALYALSALALASPAEASAGHARRSHHGSARHHERSADGGTDNPHNPFHAHRDIMKRATTADPSGIEGKTFDYIVVGGGVAGLVIGSRLSELKNQSVLVIEAGGDGSDVKQNQLIPGYTYFHGIASGTPYGWNMTTVPQTGGSNEAKYYPLGRGLGGSGAINGMFWCRGDQAEYDAWAELNPNTNVTWNWAEIDKYIKKAENLQMPPQATIDEFHMPIDVSAHGSGGLLQVGWSAFLWPLLQNWVPAWVNLGLEAHDLADGNTRGVMITPSTIDASKQERCDSRIYINGLTRENLFVLTHHQATKIFFNGTKDATGNMIASGVSFQMDAASPSYNVYTSKEIIVSSGAINSPKLLQLSGIGPSEVLTPLGIKMVLDLPVGHNFQDHASYNMVYKTAEGVRTWNELKDEATAAAALAEYEASKTGPWTYVNEAVAYASHVDLAGGKDAAAAMAAAFDIPATVASLNSKYKLPSSVQAGITAQYNIQKRWLTDSTGTLEYIMHMNGGPSEVGVQVCLQHPFSRGTLMIASTDPFATPLIDPNYFGVDIDATVMAQATEFARRFAKTDPMGKMLTGEVSPGEGITGDALVEFVRKAGWTEYHPMSTCSMLPKDKGGVVDTNLIVYGTSNLRVADASIMPLHLSSHLMASTYGVAEKVSDLIKARHNTTAAAATTISSSSASSTAAKTSTSSSAKASASQSGAVADSSEADSSPLSLGAKIGIGIGAAIAAIVIAGALLFFCMNKGKKEAQMTDKNGWYDRGAANGQWAQGNNFQGNESYPMNDQGYDRPLSHADSVNTMATHELSSRPGRQDGRF